MKEKHNLLKLNKIWFILSTFTLRYLGTLRKRKSPFPKTKYIKGNAHFYKHWTTFLFGGNFKYLEMVGKYELVTFIYFVTLTYFVTYVYTK